MRYELAATFVIFVTLLGFGVLAWAAYEAIQGLRDHIGGHWRRIRNRRIDLSVGRDVYRFVKGVHK